MQELDALSGGPRQLVEMLTADKNRHGSAATDDVREKIKEHLHWLEEQIVELDVVLFGGNQLGARGRLGDTWEWDGRNWTRVADSEPLKRDHHGLTYDTARHRVVLFGGSNGRFLADTWG